jgi:Phosphoribosylformylglycinamidine (FGAM) synthase, glutamine amidotransferase domain
MNSVKALVLSGYGLNCDHETAYCLEKAGAIAHRVHINDLTRGQCQLNDYDILVFTGGFSWGDDHGAGVLQALRMKKS